MARVDPATEAGKLGIFAAVLAVMVWAGKKLDKGWIGAILRRGSDR